MTQVLLGNFAAASAQMFAIAAFGAVLPLLFRLRHPRTHLIYCHLLLVACVLVPWVQPWRHPVVVVEDQIETSAPQEVPQTEQVKAAPASSPPSTAPPSVPTPRASLSNSDLFLWILGAGVVARVVWLLAGLWRIRNYRIRATPLHPLPRPLRAAAAISNADALFCVSADVTSPVTLGWLAPVVLLPESFASMDEEAQCGIACHELLHVRRRDWVVTVIEEITGALLWFNPGIWLVLSQTRLVREQLVDAEVVRLTASKDSYIDALLAMARGRLTLDLAPAPLFLRRRHLAHRMHSLLKDTPISRPRLASSYGFMTAMLAAAAWFGMGAFPLIGDPQIERRTAEAAPQPPIAVAQSKSTTHTVNIPTVPMPPPANAQEPVTGPAAAPESPAARAAALYLLERARQNSRLHMPGTPPFALRAAFQSWGGEQIQYTGLGELTELWQSGQSWLWTGKLGSYSQTRVGMGVMTSDREPVPVIPMRVQMLRIAIFWGYKPTSSSAQMRIAETQRNGRPLTCLLFSANAVSVNGRGWDEEEYCIDPASGALQMYSPVPGAYVVYSYEKGRQFHGRAEPDGITFYEGGGQVLDAQVEITDLNDYAPLPAGQYPAVTLGWGQRQVVLLAASPGQPANRRALVHATLDASGRVIEAEMTSAEDAAMAQTAMEFVRKGTFRTGRTNKQGGLVQYEAYLDVRIVE